MDARVERRQLTGSGVQHSARGKPRRFAWPCDHSRWKEFDSHNPPSFELKFFEVAQMECAGFLDRPIPLAHENHFSPAKARRVGLRRLLAHSNQRRALEFDPGISSFDLRFALARNGTAVAPRLILGRIRVDCQ
jgi:hypothetical protein